MRSFFSALFGLFATAKLDEILGFWPNLRYFSQLLIFRLIRRPLFLAHQKGPPISAHQKGPQKSPKFSKILKKGVSKKVCQKSCPHTATDFDPKKSLKLDLSESFYGLFLILLNSLIFSLFPFFKGVKKMRSFFLALFGLFATAKLDEILTISQILPDFSDLLKNMLF